MAVGVNPIYRVGQNYGPQGRTKGTPAIRRAQQVAGAVGARGRQPYGPGTFPRVNPGGPMQGGNIGRFTRPSGFRGLAGTRAGIPNFARTYAVGPGEAGINRARQQGQGFGGINPATQTRISGPMQQGQLRARNVAPAINLGGGREFRNAGQQNRQRQARAGGGAINLAALGVKPMRNPGVFATLAGRRAANANQANPIAQAKSRAGLNFTPKVVNPVARARARGRGF